MQVTAIPLAKVKDALSQRYRAREDEHVLAWHHEPRIVFKNARGVRLWDVDGREYLDFVSGHINVLLGHNHPELVQALAEQASKLWTHYK